MSLDEGELTQTMQNSLTAIPEKKKKTNELADPVLQPVEPVEKKSQIFSEHSLQSKEPKKATMYDSKSI